MSRLKFQNGVNDCGDNSDEGNSYTWVILLWNSFEQFGSTRQWSLNFHSASRYQAGILRLFNIALTSMLRYDVVSTLNQRCLCTTCIHFDAVRGHVRSAVQNFEVKQMPWNFIPCLLNLQSLRKEVPLYKTNTRSRTHKQTTSQFSCFFKPYVDTVFFSIQ